MKKTYWLIGFVVVLIPLFFSGDFTTSRPLPAEALLDDPVLREIDAALFQKVPLLDVEVDFPRPPAEAEQQLARMAEGASSHPKVLEALAQVQAGQLKFDAAEATMRRLAETNPDKEKGIQALADFYHERLKISEELKALERLAAVQSGKAQIGTYQKIIVLADQYLVKDYDRLAIIGKMIEAEPDEPGHVETLISRLIEEGRTREALERAEAAAGRFPKNRRSFLRLKADILLKDKKTDEALEVYKLDYDPVDNLDLYEDYLELLRRTERIKQYERGLQRRARLEQLDDRGFREYFLLLRSRRDYKEAGETLDRWIKSLGRLNASRMEKFAGAYSAVGLTQSAWRLTYSLYLSASAPSAKESALRLLFDLTWDLGGAKRNLTGRGIGTYYGLQHFDTDPGVVGGLLSLLYNTQDVDDKIEDLQAVSRDFENRKMLMRLFESFRTDYPKSPGTARMYTYVVRMFNEYNWPRTALRYAEEYLQAYPDDPRYYEVAQEAVTSLGRVGDRSKLYELYKSLIRRADGRGEEENYFKYISNLVQAYVGNKEHTNAIQLYWDEINLHPTKEALYQRFLEFLSRNRIYDEELKVYQKAVEHFADKGYHHKLARWYIRQRRQSDFQDLTREIAGIFGESELTGFFNEFLKSGRTVGEPDTVFYRTMYEYANRRFPRNMRFVEGLLSFYRSFELWYEYDALAKQYFYASESIRKDWIFSLSKRGRLEGVLGKLTGGAGLPVGTEVSLEDLRVPESPAEALLMAEAARWTSRFEVALPLFSSLAERFPGQEDLLKTKAELERSFGKTAESASTYDLLAKLHPRNKEYPTEAGEVLIESGKGSQAAARWLKVLEIDPTSEDLYLEAASIFWDYYRFNEAADVLLTARRNLKQPALFGAKLAAVYESAKDYPKAVAEYVRTVALSGDYYWETEETLNRLKYLATAKGMSREIDTAFEAAIRAEADDYRYTRAYAQYFSHMGLKDKRLDLLRGSIERYDSSDFLDWLADILRSEGDQASEERVLKRQVELSGDSLESLLALAGFYERVKRLDDAETVLRRRIDATVTEEPEALPDYLNALGDGAEFAWRHDRFDRALQWWETAARLASNRQKKSRLLALSQRYIELERYARATEILEGLLNEEPSSTAYFNTLAQIFTKQEDYQGLAALNKRAIEAVRTDDSLSADVKKFRIATLRFSLIENLVKLGDFTAALDQYIEIINRDYSAEGVIAEAYRFADKHGLVDRLINYYRSTSEKSFKDFRWNVVLANLAEQKNSLPEAADEWTKAIRNEPQRIELRQSLAAVYLRLQRYAEAVEVYREIYRLDHRNSGWILTIAQTQALAGDMTAARATLEELIKGDPPEYSKYFSVARTIESWGELEAAAEKLNAGLTKLRADIYRERLQRSDLALYLRVSLKLGRTVEAFNVLLEINAQYGREGSRQGNPRAWEARQGQQLTYDAFSGDFAQALNDYATDAERREIAQRMQGYLNDYPDNAGTIQFVRASAEKMGFASVTENAIQADLGRLNKYDTRWDYHDAIEQALAYYQERGQWREAARMLERELSRSTLFDYRSEILGLLAELYRFGGDNEKEIAALKRYFEESGGSELQMGREDPAIERYLTLLLEGGNDLQLREAVRKINAFTGQVINFFLAHKRPDLAAVAIDAAALRRTPKWRDTKKLLVQTYGGAAAESMGARASADILMSLLPIGRRLDETVDPDRILVGDEWFGFVLHFVEYLHTIAGDKRYEWFLLGPAEGGPRRAESYRAVARWYGRHELYDEALRFYETALQLKGDTRSTYSEMGLLLLKKGDKAAAKAAWDKMLEGNPGPEVYEEYFRVLSENGFKAEAGRTAFTYLEREFPKRYYFWDLDYLLNQAIDTLEELGDLSPAVHFVNSTTSAMQEPMEFLRYMLDDVELPEALELEVFKRTLEVTKQGMVTGETGDEAWDSRSMARYWMERAIEFAVNTERYDQALEWVQDYESYSFHENPSYMFAEDGFFWQVKARALLGAGRKEAALQALQKVYEEYPLDLNRHQTVYQILLDAGLKADAQNLMIGFYRNALSQGMEYMGNFTGLAGILLDRAAEEKDTAAKQRLIDEAVVLLDRLVNLSTENDEELGEAASLLESKGLTAAALRYRRMLYRQSPGNHSNTLALADGERTAGEGDTALKLYRDLLTGVGVARSVRLKAMKPFLEHVGSRPAKAAEEKAVFEGRKDLTEIDRLVYAELLRIEGRTDQFKESLDDGMQTFFEPSLLVYRRAQIALEAGNQQAALDDLRLALRNSPLPETRLTLLKTLLRTSKPLAALQLLDRYEYYGLTVPESGRIGFMLGLEDNDLLAMCGELEQAAIDAGRFDEAQSYERIRVDLAKGLKVAYSERTKEIEEMARKAQPPKPPITIDDSIAN
jgi:tetratricopeptide (TPR) repeat protein